MKWPATFLLILLSTVLHAQKARIAEIHQYRFSLDQATNGDIIPDERQGWNNYHWLYDSAGRISEERALNSYNERESTTRYTYFGDTAIETITSSSKGVIKEREWARLTNKKATESITWEYNEYRKDTTIIRSLFKWDGDWVTQRTQYKNGQLFSDYFFTRMPGDTLVTRHIDENGTTHTRYSKVTYNSNKHITSLLTWKDSAEPRLEERDYVYDNNNNWTSCIYYDNGKYRLQDFGIIIIETRRIVYRDSVYTRLRPEDLYGHWGLDAGYRDLLLMKNGRFDLHTSGGNPDFHGRWRFSKDSLYIHLEYDADKPQPQNQFLAKEAIKLRIDPVHLWLVTNSGRQFSRRVPVKLARAK